MNFVNQKAYNISAFNCDQEYYEKRQVILELIRAMNREQVIFALTCSAALFFNGITDDFNDFDIVVKESDSLKFIEVFTKILGGTLTIGQNGKESFFDSKFYSNGKIGNVEFDIISVFTVTTFGTRYQYVLDEQEIQFIDGIPVCPIEACCILYGMMTGWQQKRQMKYSATLEFLKKTGVKHPEIIQTNQEIPEFIQEDIKKLLELKSE